MCHAHGCHGCRVCRLCNWFCRFNLLRSAASQAACSLPSLRHHSITSTSPTVAFPSSCLPRNRRTRLAPTATLRRLPHNTLPPSTHLPQPRRPPPTYAHHPALRVAVSPPPLRPCSSSYGLSWTRPKLTCLRWSYPLAVGPTTDLLSSLPSAHSFHFSLHSHCTHTTTFLYLCLLSPLRACIINARRSTALIKGPLLPAHPRSPSSISSPIAIHIYGKCTCMTSSHAVH